ncbi:hypothetical protein FACS1894155_05360 [Bacteroidia bacterium]|nr:hypothetical protein FACS1894155_05360 [Bacteroidia bacterium]
MGTKKLTLKKETITNLSESEQSFIRGGGDTWNLACLGSAIMMGACSAVGGCDPEEPEVEPESEYYGSCEDTCGSKYTCNGVV